MVREKAGVTNLDGNAILTRANLALEKGSLNEICESLTGYDNEMLCKLGRQEEGLVERHKLARNVLTITIELAQQPLESNDFQQLGRVRQALTNVLTLSDLLVEYDEQGKVNETPEMAHLLRFCDLVGSKRNEFAAEARAKILSIAFDPEARRKIYDAAVEQLGETQSLHNVFVLVETEAEKATRLTELHSEKERIRKVEEHEKLVEKAVPIAAKMWEIIGILGTGPIAGKIGSARGALRAGEAKTAIDLIGGMELPPELSDQIEAIVKEIRQEFDIEE